MKYKKILALGLAAAMMASMAVGVSASSTSVRIAASGDTTPSSGSANVDVEGLIEPTENTATDELLPTDPSKTSDVSSGWVDPVVDNTSQLLVTAPTKMKFVVRGQGNTYGNASLVAEEAVSGTVKNASAYIPDNDGTVVPKTVTVAVSTVNLNGTSEFNLLSNTATKDQMEAFGGKKGSVQGLDIQLGTNPVRDFAAAAGVTLGTLEKGSITSSNSVLPSSASIRFATNANMHTVFESSVTGRLVNNYTMGLTFSYNR